MSGVYWLASYPKSGNTWFRLFLQNLEQGGDWPVDINTLPTGDIASSRVWLDDVLGFDTTELDADEMDCLRPDVYRWSLGNAKTTYHKIHDAYTCTSKGEALIGLEATLGALYIVRNPLDVACSLATYWSWGLDETIESMARHNMTLSGNQNRLSEQVRQKLLTWSEHVKSWVDTSKIDRLVIRYEDMLCQPIETFTRAVRFFNLPVEPHRIEQAIRFSDFKVLSQQEEKNGFRECLPQVRRFFREGKSGSWRHQLSVQQVARIISDHGEVMLRFGYLDDFGQPV